MKLANFASLDPKIRESGRTGLEGASAQDRRVWGEFNSDWTRLIMDAEAIAVSRSASTSASQSRFRDSATPATYETFAGPSTTSVMIEQRVGQNFFRRAVLANYDNKCCVTGIADTRLLNASHIKPWAADEHNRHNPRNGLCLSATFDRAFDRGLMAVDDAGKARFSKTLLESASAETRAFFDPYEGRPLLTATRFDPDPAFLDFHRTTLFKPDRIHA
jgi:putative restriction endonuclease